MPEATLEYKYVNLWHLLLDEGGIDEESLLKVKEDAHFLGKDFLEVLYSSGSISEEANMALMAGAEGIQIVDEDQLKFDPDLVLNFPSHIAKMYDVIPLEENESEVSLLCYNPTNDQMREELAFALGKRVTLFLASRLFVMANLQRLFPKNFNLDLEDTFAEGLEDMLSAVAEEDEEDEEEGFQTNVTVFVDKILKEAIKLHASDIHIEPFADELILRFRVDGFLYEVDRLPIEISASTISRVKVLSSMNISERRKPQDGRIDMSYAGRSVDMRVSTLPTQYGESVCIRVLDRDNTFLSLDSLGMSDEFLARIRSVINRPNGIFIVTGPTGSGKSTTLYSCLSEIDTGKYKVLTAEDPVEYDLDDVVQVGINEGIGLDYSRVLRAFLRQDPDRMMVGEIRDFETANIAIQAALTGHLVYTTLHTNDAAGAVTRLVDMGVKPYLIASSLVGVLAQRLLRKVCSECKTAYKPRKEELDRLGVKGLGTDDVFYYGKGCSCCSRSGYKGRIPILEYLEIDNEQRSLIINESPSSVIQEMAVKNGMTTLRQHGIMKLLAGETTVREVLKYT